MATDLTFSTKRFLKLLFVFWAVQIIWNVGFSLYATSTLAKYGATWNWVNDPLNWLGFAFTGLLWVILIAVAVVQTKRASALTVAIVVQCVFNFGSVYEKMYEARQKIANHGGPPISMQ
jgi:hypothetical protein